MELVFIFTVVLFEVLFIDFFEVVKIIRALWIYVFMNDEIFPVFLRDESVAAMRTSKFDGREATFIRREMGVTDFAEKLSFGTIILINEDGSSCPRYRRKSDDGWEESSYRSAFRSKE